MNYHLYLYFSTGKEETSLLESFFSILQVKLCLHIDYGKLITGQLSEKLKRDKNSINSFYDPKIKQEERNYKQILKEYEGEAHAHDIASHESDLSYFTHYKSFQLSQIEEDHIEYLDHHFKFSLVSLYSVFESQLFKLCEILKKETSSKISLSDFSGKNYLETVLKYFNLVIDLNVSPLDSIRTKINELQFLRNKIVHNNAEFDDENIAIIQQIITQHPKEIELINTDDQKKQLLIIKRDKFVVIYQKAVHDFFETLYWILFNKFDGKLLKPSINHIFKSIGLTAYELQKKAISSGIEINVKLKEVKDSDLGIIQAKIQIKKGNGFSIINQIDENQNQSEKIRELSEYLQQHTDVFKSSFPRIIIPKDYNLFTIMIF